MRPLRRLPYMDKKASKMLERILKKVLLLGANNW